MRAIAAGFVVFMCAASARAQGGARATEKQKECVVAITGVQVNGVPTTHLTVHNKDTTWAGAGVDAKCEGTDQRILSDSAEHYADKKLLILIGHVHYTEKRLKLDADRLTYYTGDEKLIAEGNVVSVTNTGTRFAGPHAEYLRPAVGVRAKSHLTAEPRSSIWVSPQDAGKDSKDSVNIQADRIVMDNDSLIFAKGIVVIERPDLLSTSDSAFVDKYTEFARLMQTPKVIGRGDRHFTLEGELIDIFSKAHEVERVKSSGHAKSVSDDVTLDADTIDLRVATQKLERAYAWGRSRAHANSKEQKITADSIDVMMPGQVLRTMYAVGNALAESIPDSAKLVSKKLDYLQGQTIVAQFDTLAKGDTASQPSIRQIFAMGIPGTRAKTYYQAVRASQAKTDEANVNYALADSITVRFRQKKVFDVRMRGNVEGFYIEAVTDTSKTKKDSTAAKPAATPAEKKKP